MLTLCGLVQNFIKKYVQCYNCGNPETVVKIRKENIYLKCKACGSVSDVDMRHRLNTYILKNPPEEKVSKAEKKCAPPLISLLQCLCHHAFKGHVLASACAKKALHLACQGCSS